MFTNDKEEDIHVLAKIKSSEHFGMGKLVQGVSMSIDDNRGKRGKCLSWMMPAIRGQIFFS